MRCCYWSDLAEGWTTAGPKGLRAPKIARIRLPQMVGALYKKGHILRPVVTHRSCLPRTPTATAYRDVANTAPDMRATASKAHLATALLKHALSATASRFLAWWVGC